MAPELKRRCVECTGPIWTRCARVCPDCRRIRQQGAERRYKARKRAERPAVVSHCRDCKVQLAASVAPQTYLCIPCRKARKNKRNRVREATDSARERRAAARRTPEEKARVQQYSRKWYLANRGRVSARARAYREANRARYATYAATRRARLANAGGSFTSEEWQALIDRYAGRCAYCGAASDELTVDHVVPLSKGGSNAIENIVPACFSCNSAKHTKPAWEFFFQLEEAG